MEDTERENNETDHVEIYHKKLGVPWCLRALVANFYLFVVFSTISGFAQIGVCSSSEEVRRRQMDRVLC